MGLVLSAAGCAGFAASGADWEVVTVPPGRTNVRVPLAPCSQWLAVTGWQGPYIISASLHTSKVVRCMCQWSFMQQAAMGAQTGKAKGHHRPKGRV